MTICGGIPHIPLYTSYILEVFFNDNSITKIEYHGLPNVPHHLVGAAFGSFKGRALITDGHNGFGQCLEFDQEEYLVIPSLNVIRFNAASTWIQGKVVVTGGLCRWWLRNLDSIEILDWDESNHGSQWIKSPSMLPIKISGDTLVTLNNKLYLIGGRSCSKCWSKTIVTIQSKTKKP